MSTIISRGTVTLSDEILATKLDVAQASSIASKAWENTEVSILDIIDWMDHPDSKKATAAYLLGKISGQRRRKGSIVSRSAIALDVDYPTETFVVDLKCAIGDAVFLLHDTFSSSDVQRRYRVIIPLAESVLPDIYLAEARRLVGAIGKNYFDPSTVQAERGMYRPATQWDGYHYLAEGSTLHTVNIDDLQIDVPVAHMVDDFDPYKLQGVVGAFNRTFDSLEALVERFQLPYTKTGNRWSYTKAKSQGGLVEMSPGVWFSHHASDPVGGHRATAFDLVAAHMYGDLDTDESKPLHQRASFKKMMDFARSLPEVVAEEVRGKDAFLLDQLDTLSSGSEEKEKAPVDLRVFLRQNYYSKTHGHVPASVEVLDFVFTRDELLAGIEYDQLAGQMISTIRPPWRSHEESGRYVLHDADVAAILSYLWREYNIGCSKATMELRLDEMTLTRGYSPVKRYLESLPEWDGEERLRGCAPGVVPSDYSDMVMRKALCAAIARAYEPGCKWDHVVILQGSEGLGKSLFLERLFQGLTSTLSQVDSTDALREAHRSWAVIADEGGILTAKNFNALKEFVTRTHDLYREAYARRAIDAPRKFVIWATTNDEFFLQNRQGNRRFLVLRCEGKADFDLLLNDDYIAQLWAEALAYYRMGEPLYLTDEEMQLSADVRDEFTRTDVIEGVVASFADSLVTQDWDDLSIEERRQWIVQRDAGLVAGTATRDEICAAQVWVEGLGKPIADARDSDYSRIETALKALEGFSMSERKIYLPGYGRQRVFIRDLE